MHNTVEFGRITGAHRAEWQRWGTYLFNRSWGNVRESAPSEEEPWVAFPFEQANSRVYRWSEDGIGGFCDAQQLVCLSVAFWNEQDPILKERYFGLGNEPGNHGEGIKDYFFLLDGLPSYSYMKMLYKYPQVEFPYDRLYKENLRRGQNEAAFELIDALVNTFHENRYFDIFVEYAKADTEDILCRITAVNRGNQAAPLHILPQVCFRNTWQQGGARPELYAEGDETVHLKHDTLGERWWQVEAPNNLLFTENESNTVLLFDNPNPTPYVKDGIDHALVRGQVERVNPQKHGTKCAADCYEMVEPGASWVVRVRFQRERSQTPFVGFDAVFEQRLREAEEFYTALQRADITAEDQDIQRKAFAALNWNRKFYHFNIDQWLNEDDKEKEKEPNEKSPFEAWRHFDAHDIISIPDPWEYPWFALWDLDFQLVTLGLIDPEFAKRQVLLMLDKRYMHSNGMIPAFEGDFSMPHPPLHAWAAWHVYQQTQDRSFLQNAYTRLKRNHAWWLKTQNQGEQYLFGGGFLGMDNISVLNRSEDVPEGGWLAQADATGWMALFTLNLLAMAIELGADEDAATFLTHFVQIRKALLTLWDDETQFFYDLLYTPEAGRMLLKVRSLVGLVPLTAALLLDPASLAKLPQLRANIDTLRRDVIEFKEGVNGCYLLTALSLEKINALLKAVFDPDEFYSPYGMRSLSKFHEQHPVSYKIGDQTFDLKYEPGEASKKMFGGNSNWRGPIWAPLNQLVIEALYNYHEYFGDEIRVPGTEYLPLDKAAHDLVRRLINLFQRDDKDCRPLNGDNAYFQSDPHWCDYLWFYEHFHGETGEGLGASHQNGWTALIAMLIQTEGRASFVPKPPQPQTRDSTVNTRNRDLLV